MNLYNARLNISRGDRLETILPPLSTLILAMGFGRRKDRRFLPPHPGPLPWGEGVNSTAFGNKKLFGPSAASLVLSLLVLLLPAISKADSIVVFNEVMYHPAANEPTLEWVELHNQNA